MAPTTEPAVRRAENILQFLAMQEYARRMGVWEALPSNWAYKSLEDFYYREATDFTAGDQPLIERYAPGPKKQCFNNTIKLCMVDQSLTYCEGYGFAGGRVAIPCHHAWAITHDGKVVDPTWDFYDDREYFGIPFRTEYVIKVMMKEEVSVLDWTRTPELLQKPLPEKAKAKIVKLV